MDNPERIRQMLLESQATVDEERGWEGVQTRAVRAKRRHRSIQSLGTVVVVAVVIGLGVGLSDWLTGSTEIAAPTETTSTSAIDQSEVDPSEPSADWVAPDPSSSLASGLTIDSIPPGFRFRISTGTADLERSVVFHHFISSDGTEFSVGRYRQPAPLSGTVVTVDGREFTIVESPSGIRVMLEVDDGVRVDVYSSQMDAEALLEIAKGVTYDPGRDPLPPVP